jgi:hypothetical protein
MSRTGLILPTLTKAQQRRINDRTNDLLSAQLAAVPDDPDAPKPDPVTVFVPADDPFGRDEALARAITSARAGYDVDPRHGHARRRTPR